MNRKQVKNEGEYTPWIHLKDVHDKTRVYEYKLEGCMVVGRDPHLCDVAIVDGVREAVPAVYGGK